MEKRKKYVAPLEKKNKLPEFEEPPKPLKLCLPDIPPNQSVSYLKSRNTLVLSNDVVRRRNRKDGYLLYRRSAEDGDKLATIQMWNSNTEVDNRWVVPYSSLLLKAYKAHINMEYLTPLNRPNILKIYSEVLIMIEDLCLQIASKVLNQLGMRSLNRSAAASSDIELRDQQNYNTINLFPCVQSNASGRTSKTSLIRLILAAVRSQNDIVLVLVTSGIAATLLPGGKNAHSALKLPLRCIAAKRSINWDILTSIAGNWERKMLVGLTTGRISLPQILQFRNNKRKVG
ncbi:unnamed protein product [Onchocerca ochengi]|uniref:ATP-dependent DNA helicase n=1 Tax=Onchocerca ochengi TaxID=42157 RepID=A0A182EC32_ONCOC|nr:unnamed protein product [Onchocerca ochengi]